MKKGVGSKQKGGEFERSICRRFSLWVTNMSRDDVFWRSASSGARQTLRSQKSLKVEGFAQGGDIVAVHPLGYLLVSLFFIECKHLSDLRLRCWLYGKEGKRTALWDKPLREARAAKKEPLIIAKENNQDSLVLVTNRGARILEAGGTRFFRRVAQFTAIGAECYRLRDVLTKVEFDRIREEFSGGLGTDSTG